MKWVQISNKNSSKLIYDPNGDDSKIGQSTKLKFLDAILKHNGRPSSTFQSRFENPHSIPHRRSIALAAIGAFKVRHGKVELGTAIRNPAAARVIVQHGIDPPIRTFGLLPRTKLCLGLGIQHPQGKDVLATTSTSSGIERESGRGSTAQPNEVLAWQWMGIESLM